MDSNGKAQLEALKMEIDDLSKRLIASKDTNERVRVQAALSTALVGYQALLIRPTTQ